MRHLGSKYLARIRSSRLALSCASVLDPSLATENQNASIELVVDHAIAALGVAVDRRCIPAPASAILRLWELRAILPVKVRPFASAEKAVEVLEALNPANVNNRFFDVAAGPPGKDSWLATAIAVDKAARVMLRACARLAASDPDGRMSEFVKLAESAGLNVDPENAYLRMLRIVGREEGEDAARTKERAAVLTALREFSKAAKAIKAALAAEADRATSNPG